MGTPLHRKLIRLDAIARSLAETRSLKEVKSLRDKAEAARHYAKSAMLSLKIQNQAAEVRLRAERRAGELLAELVTHGGNRRSRSHDAILKLSDLGINLSQSARWRREAAVPEAIFDQYISVANKMGQDITAQGLLRLERLLSAPSTTARPLKPAVARCNGTARDCNVPELLCRNGIAARTSFCEVDAREKLVREGFDELKDHRNLLKKILSPFCASENVTLRRSERRLITRLLQEIDDLVTRLELTWFDPDFRG